MDAYTPDPSAPPTSAPVETAYDLSRLNFAHGYVDAALPGFLVFPDVHVTFAGGSYMDADKLPARWYGVSMARELPPVHYAHGHVDCKDFSIPNGHDLVEEVEWALRQAVLYGRPVFVGCMGGTGRTGLFLAYVVAVLWPDADPIPVVRDIYKPHAVETLDQCRMVEEFSRSAERRDMARRFRRMARWASVSRRLARLMFPPSM